jgi:hypothetical protein
MGEIILTSNSGTTFLRTGGENNIKIKSNIAWTFYILPLNDENLIMTDDGKEVVGICTAMTEDEEILSTLSGTGTTTENISWINVINDLGDKNYVVDINGLFDGKNKGITGQGTTYLTIRADENYTGKDLFAVGFASGITEPLCDFTVFEQYGKNYYFMYFDYDEQVSGQTIHTPGSSSSTVTNETISLGIDSNVTEIPVEMYTNTKCKVTIHGFSGINSDIGEEFVIGPGVTRTGYPDEEFVFKFHVPENKTSENVVYTLRATSEDDPRYTEEWYVVHKGVTPEIVLYPETQQITSNTTAFTVNYQIKPLTLSVDLGIFKEGVLLETKHISNSSSVSQDGYYRGAITYECGENLNKGNGYTLYEISGETVGKTFQVQSNIARIEHLYESWYFELIYGSQHGYSVDVYNVDGDSGGKYDVAVHTNYSYTEFNLSSNGSLIHDCSIIPVSEDYFNVQFNVEINKESSRSGSITVSRSGGPSGTINVNQNGGSEPPSPTYTFYWNYDGDAWNGDAGSFSDGGETRNVTYHSTYPGGLTFRNLGYNWISGSDRGGYFSVTVSANDTGGDRTGSFGVRYNGTDIGFCTVSQGSQTISWKYQFKFNYSCNNILEVGDIAYITSVTIKDNQIGVYAVPDTPLQIDPTQYTPYESDADVYTTYEGGTHVFEIKIQWNISGVQQSDYIDEVTEVLPTTGGNVEINFGWIDLPVQY